MHNVLLVNVAYLVLIILSLSVACTVFSITNTSLQQNACLSEAPIDKWLVKPLVVPWQPSLSLYAFMFTMFHWGPPAGRVCCKHDGNGLFRSQFPLWDTHTHFYKMSEPTEGIYQPPAGLEPWLSLVGCLCRFSLYVLLLLALFCFFSCCFLYVQLICLFGSVQFSAVEVSD